MFTEFKLFLQKLRYRMDIFCTLKFAEYELCVYVKIVNSKVQFNMLLAHAHTANLQNDAIDSENVLNHIFFNF